MSARLVLRILTLSLLIVVALSASAAAQTSAQEQAAKLREQLVDVQTKQEQQQTRLQQLEEQLKPENIEHSLAGVGSTHPEELREQRRRQLEKEKVAVQTQLDQLAVSRQRLETAVAAADARAYQESARPATSVRGPQVTTDAAAPATPAPAAKPASKSKSRTRRRRARRVSRAVPFPPLYSLHQWQETFGTTM